MPTRQQRLDAIAELAAYVHELGEHAVARTPNLRDYFPAGVSFIVVAFEANGGDDSAQSVSIAVENEDVLRRALQTAHEQLERYLKDFAAKRAREGD